MIPVCFGTLSYYGYMRKCSDGGLMNGQTVVFEVCVQMGLGLGGFDDGIQEPLEAKNDSPSQRDTCFLYFCLLSP
jgi:hypothetical protein